VLEQIAEVEGAGGEDREHQRDRDLHFRTTLLHQSLTGRYATDG
jgi:hypothetical protein